MKMPSQAEVKTALDYCEVKLTKKNLKKAFSLIEENPGDWETILGDAINAGVFESEEGKI